MATPLVRIPQEQGGTLYAFASAARDLTRAYYNPDINFEFSKFALAQLPQVATPALGSTNNYVQFGNLFDASGAGYDDTSVDNANVHFAQTFQNYALNFEQLILTDDDFDPTIFKSDAEQIFFKWLYEIGGIRWQAGTSQEVSSGYSRFLEHDESTGIGTEYSKVIKYIGNIDVSNDKNYQGNTYNEVFINVPSVVGYTPEILFKSGVWNTTSVIYNPGTYIEGRAGQNHPDANLNVEALADSNQGEINFDPNVEPSFGIEFDAAKYAKVIGNPELNSLFDYAKLGGDFSFNAILVYYDIYSKSTTANKSTNLYGVLILDNFKEDPNQNGWYIPSLTKYKPNDVTGLNGNSFALKLNVKFNSSLDNVGVEKNIDSFSTFSMDIFLDTTAALDQATKLLLSASNRYDTIAAKVVELENLLLTSTQVGDFANKIQNLETAIEDAKLNYSNSSSLLQLIQSTNKRINQLLDGTVPSEVQYNIDVIKQGLGTELDKSVPGFITIKNKVHGYELIDAYNFDISNASSANWSVGSKIQLTNKFIASQASSTAIWLRYKNYTNRINLWVDNTSTLTSDLNIYIDDSITKWKVGQVLKFNFKTNLLLAGQKIKFITDKNGVNGWKVIGQVYESDLISNKPYIELICVDETNKSFEIDILR
jgi:hypothetical protein